MGYIRHHAIVVTGAHEWPYSPSRSIHEAHRVAVSSGCALVTDVVGPGVNGFSSFLVAPDGSKEGWNDSDAGDQARGDFIAWLRDQEGYFSWAEVILGDDDHEAHVERHGWDQE